MNLLTYVGGLIMVGSGMSIATMFWNKEATQNRSERANQIREIVSAIFFVIGGFVAVVPPAIALLMR